jgi:hypothetical protein
MSLEVGALSLKITEDNLKAVLKDVNAIDQGAGRVARTINSSVAPSFQGLSRQSAQAGREIQLVGLATGQAYSQAARKIAATGATIAAAGEASTGALTKLISIGSNMAFAFGPEGAIAASVGITTLAIVTMFQRSRDEMQKTRETFEKELNKMVNAADVAGLKNSARNILLSGNTEGTGKREEGLTALGAREAKLVNEYNYAIRSRNALVLNAAKAGLRDVRAKMAPLQKQYDEITAAITNPFPRQGVGASPITVSAKSNSALAAEREKAAKEAERIRVMRQHNAVRALSQPTGVEVGGIPLTQRRGTGPDDNIANLASGNVTVKARAGADKVVEQSAAFYKKITEEQLANIQKMGEILDAGIANTLGSAIYNGFAAAFDGGGIGGMIQEFGKTILAGIGNIMAQMGQVWIEYGIAMTALGAALWNPFTSGPAAIAIGALLMALGGALGAVAHGGGGRGKGGGYSGVGGSTSTDEITKITLVPTRAGMASDLNPKTAVNVTVIGPDDPRAQTQLLDLINNAMGRAA